MRPVSINITTTGLSSPVVLDQFLNPFDVTLALNFTSGSGNGTVTVQYSTDDPFATYATDYNTNANWINLTALTNKAADIDAALSSVVRAVRANCSVFNGGIIAFRVIQGGGA